MPKRIQRKRAAGWRMPEGAVYVGRGRGEYGKWGNPYRVGTVSIDDADAATHCFAEMLKYGEPELYPSDEEIRTLRGKDLVCWCALDQPCHADVLLKIANS